MPMVPGSCASSRPRPRPVNENAVRVVAILGSTMRRRLTSRCRESARRSTGCRPNGAGTSRCTSRRRLGRVRRPVPASGPGMGLPGAAGGLDQCLGTSTAWSTRVGWVIWRDPAEPPEDLIFKVNYLGGDCHLRSTSPGPARRSRRSIRSSGLAGRATGMSSRPAGHRALPVRRDRQAGPRRAARRRQRAAGVRVQAARRRDDTRSSTCPSGCASAAGRFQAYTFPEDMTDTSMMRIVTSERLRRGPGRPCCSSSFEPRADSRAASPQTQPPPEIRQKRILQALGPCHRGAGQAGSIASQDRKDLVRRARAVRHASRRSS